MYNYYKDYKLHEEEKRKQEFEEMQARAKQMRDSKIFLISLYLFGIYLTPSLF